MFKIIFEKELKEILSSSKFIITFGVCSLLIILSFFTGAEGYKMWESRYNSQVSENLRQMSGLTDWRRINHNVYLPPQPLAALVNGVSNDIGQTMAIRGTGELKAVDSQFQENPLFAVFKFLDLEFIFQIILSLFAILFAYNAINGEKEMGTLKLSFANSLPKDSYILGKLAIDGATVEAKRQALVQKIGENISVRRFQRFQSANRLMQYLHGGGRIGVTVEFSGGSEAVGKDVAMHVAASVAAIRPVCVSREQVPADLVERERQIYLAQAKESGKPEDIAKKMVEGRIQKYLAEVTLLGQPFVKNPDETVEKYLKANGAAVQSFALYVVGEGIEKKSSDFAAEVAAMTKG